MTFLETSFLVPDYCFLHSLWLLLPTHQVFGNSRHPRGFEWLGMKPLSGLWSLGQAESSLEICWLQLGLGEALELEGEEGGKRWKPGAEGFVKSLLDLGRTCK